MSNPSSSLFEGPDFSAAPDDAFDTDLDQANTVEDADREPGNSAEATTAEAVLSHIARSIVDEPESVVVEAGHARGGVKLSLHVDQADMGRIIGKRGRVAQAIRTVVRAAGARDGEDVSVDIVD